MTPEEILFFESIQIERSRTIIDYKIEGIKFTPTPEAVALIKEINENNDLDEIRLAVAKAFGQTANVESLTAWIEKKKHEKTVKMAWRNDL